MALVIAPEATASDSFDPTLANVTLFAPTGPQTVGVTLSQLESASYPTYTGPAEMEQYDAAGADTPADLAPDAPPAGTWPLSEVLEAALGAVTPASTLSEVESIVVFTDGNAPESPLSQSDIAQPSDFQNPQESPVITEYGGYEDYYRPRRPGGGDANASDRVGDNPINSPDEDAPINIQVSQATTFPTTITASPTSITAGQSIDFTAQPEDPSGDALQYVWDFDGQAPQSHVEDPRDVTFPTAGVFRVAFQATDPNGTIGPAEITITVNPSTSAHASTQTGTDTTPGVGGTAGSGPIQSTGTNPGAGAGTVTAPASQSVAVSRTPTAPVRTATHTTGITTTQTETSAHTTTGAATSAGNRGLPGTGATQSVGGAGPSDGSGTASLGQRGIPASSHVTSGRSEHAVGQPPVRSAVTPRHSSSTKLISGLLISRVDPSADGAGATANRVDHTPHAPALAPAGHVSSLAAFAAGVGVLVLLGLGVGRELRGRRFRDRGNRPRTA